MKKTLFATTLAMAMSQAALAQENPAVESESSDTNSGTYWGVGIGTALGAILGGPVGAAAGAALGGSVGYGHDQGEALESTERKLDNQMLTMSAQEGELKKSQSELDTLKRNVRQLKRINALQSAELADLKAKELSEREQAKLLSGIAKHYSQEVYYRHNESSIPDYAKTRIDGLAEFMTEHPSVRLSLQGHTDLLGAEDANLALSQARVDAIRDHLVDLGVNAERIQTKAMGEAEATAARGDVSNYVLDRRVAFVLSVDGPEQPLAANTGGR